MSRWYYARGQVPVGPVPLDRLQTLVRAGELKPTDLVLQEGTTQWVPASSVMGVAVGPPPMPVAARAPVGPPSLHPQGYQVEPPRLVPFDEGPPGDAFAEFFRRCFTWNLCGVTPSAAERARLEEHAVTEPAAQKYLVWRRSLLWFLVPLASLSGVIAAINQLIDLANLSAGDPDMARQGIRVGLTALGTINVTLLVLSYFAVPFAAVAAALLWSRPRASQRVLLLGWILAFAVPLLLALVPISWQIRLEGVNPEGERVLMQTLSALAALGSLFTLMPVVLALIGGAVAGCVRVKGVVPQSVLPGWFVVVLSCFQALLFLVMFIVLSYLGGSFVMILAALLWLVVPLITAAGGGMFTRAAPTTEALGNVGVNRIIHSAVMAPAVVLFVVGLFTTNVFGTPLLSFSGQSVLNFGKLLELFVGYIGRAMFMTVLAVDLFLRITLSAWRESARFHESSAGAQQQGLGQWERSLGG